MAIQIFTIINMETQGNILIFSSYETNTRGSSFDNPIPIEEFKKEVENFYKTISQAFVRLDNMVGQYSLEEITINAEFNASGKIGILAFGAEAGIKGGISFKLVRKKTD